jgi:hypothetical protein
VNPVRRLLLGAGEFPPDLRQSLEAEGIMALDQGLPGSITYRHYRAPRRYSSYRKEGMTGAIAVTGQRLVVWGRRTRQIDVPLIHPSRALIEVRTEPPDHLYFSYDAAKLSSDRSGSVEIHLRTPAAAHIMELLSRRQ